jgi:uncharacterized coiled-coil DUF342 family protein
MEDLSSIRAEIQQLHERSQNTKMEVKVLGTKWDERHATILEKIEKMDSELEKLAVRFDKEISSISTKIDELNTLANQGKTSLKTLWFLGGLIAGTLALIAAWLDLFK